MTPTQAEHDQNDTLASLLEHDAVPISTLHTRYGALLELVQLLIGVVPNCDRYLEIWPPAFRTYNIIVPNFLNLPFSVFGIGGAPKDILGLGIYVASRSAECPYCSAHTCSFALRRGASPDKVAGALVGGEDFSERELAAITVARSLARVPCELTYGEKQALLRCFSPSEAEWIVLGIVMMGFLNKFMDAVGVERPGTRLRTKKEILISYVIFGVIGAQTVLAWLFSISRLAVQVELGVIATWFGVALCIFGVLFASYAQYAMGGQLRLEWPLSSQSDRQQIY